MNMRLNARAGGRALLVLMMMAAAQPAIAREQLRVVGSSTVYPFVATVAELFGRSGEHRTPIVEATGTGGGIKLFCEGVGAHTPDLVNASRPIKDAERAMCTAHGVTEILEYPIGFDGIVLANAKGAPVYQLTLRQLFLALAAQVPEGDRLVPNHYKHWSEIDPALPDVAIEVYGPPSTSGTRDAFVEIAMEKACEGFEQFTATYSDAKARARQCHLLREDGAYIDAGENDNIIVQKLVNNHDALGIFGFSFLEENADKVQPSRVDGVTPSFETIADASYPISRSLYVYAKPQNGAEVVGLPQFLTLLTSERSAGDEGVMAIKGLIPMPASVREENRARVAAWVPHAVP